MASQKHSAIQTGVQHSTKPAAAQDKHGKWELGISICCLEGSSLSFKSKGLESLVKYSMSPSSTGPGPQVVPPSL